MRGGYSTPNATSTAGTQTGPLRPLLDDDSDPAETYVADTNIFADKPGGPGCLEKIQAEVLDDPNKLLLVPDAVYEELAARPSPAQDARVAGKQGGARTMRIPNGDVSGLDVRALASNDFDENDIKIIQAAKERKLPEITASSSLIRQIHSGRDDRKAQWGNVVIYAVCE